MFIFYHRSDVHDKTTVHKDKLKHTFVVYFGVRAKGKAEPVPRADGLVEDGKVQFGQHSPRALAKVPPLLHRSLTTFAFISGQHLTMITVLTSGEGQLKSIEETIRAVETAGDGRQAGGGHQADHHLGDDDQHRQRARPQRQPMRMAALRTEEQTAHQHQIDDHIGGDAGVGEGTDQAAVEAAHQPLQPAVLPVKAMQ